MSRQFALACGVSACMALLGGCIYRMEIQQGNLVTQESVSQLKQGMTKDQVKFILGTPLVVDIFHAERWDYVYTLQPARSRSIKEERRLTLYFDKDGRLERVDGDVVPGATGSGRTADNAK